ncbi:MAG TPA: Gfo/Idh/MocA family oxidoreductase [Verrucomicrobiales bacterium]|nr:Gfo/Idh/MocA family oxidoreductase [Verrucomicrobiales bacterium]
MTAMKRTRRSFIAQLGTAAAASPFILPSHLSADQAVPSKLINMAFIGMGIQNRGLMKNFLQRPVKVLAVCDVDRNRREHARKMVETFHKEHSEKGAFACKSYADFQEVLALKDVDAVCIATPDHWHALITIAALKAGKDIYCEKPLTHNIQEAITVMATVKETGRVLQTGSMQRSMLEFRVACELVRNGLIGRLERVTCKVGDPGRPCDLGEEEAGPGVDWDRWLGPAPRRPYHSVLCPREVHRHFPAWRRYSEYGGGAICDFGAHHFDIAQWGLGMDDSGPVEVRPPEKEDALRGAVMVYQNGVTVEQSDGEGMRYGGVRFYGTEGDVEVDRGSFRLVHDGKEYRSAGQAEKLFLAEAKVKLYRNPKSHPDDFLARVADRKRPCTSEIEGGHTAICCHLVNLAYAHRKIIKWDPSKKIFTDPSCDKAWLTRDYRAPWKV